jgi:deazaflavin-dependent oxidoreductase (nitroreductase family)
MSFNERVIDEFRANEGRVGGPFADMPLLLLTTTGARSGRPHTTPLAYLEDGGRYVVFGSKGGAPTNPDWYHNLRANPGVAVELGADSFRARARVAEGEEREDFFERQKAARPVFADYERRTTRAIPVIVLEPLSSQV